MATLNSIYGLRNQANTALGIGSVYKPPVTPTPVTQRMTPIAPQPVTVVPRPVAPIAPAPVVPPTPAPVIPPPVAPSTPTPVAPVVPTPAPEAPKSIFDIYGMEKPADVYSLYGVEKPAYAAPNTSQYDAPVNNYLQADQEADIQRQLDARLASIRQKYDVDRTNIARRTESERQSTLSGLYDVGVVNPLSSGVNSLTNDSHEILDRRNAALSAAQAAEEADAQAVAYKAKTEATQNKVNLAKEERARVEQNAQEKYTRDRQSLTDTVGMIDSVVDAFRSGKAIAREERDSARAGINTITTQFGSAAFDGMDEVTLQELSKAAGYPPGVLQKGVQTLKERELEAKKTGKKLELREVNGSLYNITTNSEGNVKTELLIKGKPTGTGAGTTGFSGVLEKLNTSKGSDGFVNTQMYSDLYDSYRSIGKASSFTTNFPPEEFLNPKDPTALKFLQTASQATKDSGGALTFEDT